MQIYTKKRFKLRLLWKLLFTKHFIVITGDKENKKHDMLSYNDTYNNCLYYGLNYFKSFEPSCG